MRTAAKTHSAPDGSVDATGHALGVAHDLRNLLFVMSAQLQRATRQLPADDPLRHELDVIRDTSDRASALTRYFLSSGRGVPMPQPTADINAVVRGMKHVLAQVVGTRICLRIKLARRLWPVAVHSTQIERVLLNLVINARDAMPEGGTVCITTDNRRAAGEAGEGSVVVTVRDTGMGMPPRVRAQVFEPFYTTKPGGTGIGLTTVRAIASIAGGGVDIDTVAGKGTAVSVSLPRTRRIPRARRDERVHAHQFTRGPARA
jgi:signal transduction histidine kinase